MSPLRSFIVFAGVLFSSTYAYVEFGSLTLPFEPTYEPTPRPNQLLGEFDLRYEVLPSMITAVAPGVALAANGTRQTTYSLHYHRLFSKTRQGRGVFDKRGVFSGDPPIATCTPCGGSAVTYTPPTLTTSSQVCTTHPYHGVFDLPASSTPAACYNSNYTGVLQPSTTSYTGLPCCFTIPASCLLNRTAFANSSTRSFMATSGVFRSTSTSTTSTLSTTSRFSLSTPTSTSGSTSQSQSQSQSQSKSQSQSQTLGAILIGGTTSSTKTTSASPASTRKPVIVISGTTMVITLTSRPSTIAGSSSSPITTAARASSSTVSSNPYTSPSTSVTMATTSYSIIVISSTTITLTRPGTTATTSKSGGFADLPTLTVITASTTSFNSSSIVTRTTEKSNTIVGCGVASGSGIIEGTGVVELGGINITASGTASGYASHVTGCGTIVATTGSFSGVASITGCGFGYGVGTLTGEGTVFPWFGAGFLSFVSSGVVSGAGSFLGCGTITGSGYFSATTGSPVIITTAARPTKTVSVYLSYCPDTTADAGALFRLGSDSNGTDTASLASMNINNTTPYISPYTNSGLSDSNSTTPSNSTINPLCQICPNSVGVCCPPTVSCDASDGKCPLYALENSGNTINGYLIQQVVNSSAPVAGRKKVRALAKKNVQELGIGSDLVKLEMEVEQSLKKHKAKRKGHHKNF